MVHRGKTGPPGCPPMASKCTVTGVIWVIVGWVLLIQAYTTLFPPPAPPSIFADEWTLVSDIRKGFDGNRLEKKSRKPSDVEESLREWSYKQQMDFYFPDKGMAINPLKTVESDTNYFYPGREWRDTDGKPIQAHGGGILYDKETKTFYWYGENKDGRTYRFKRSLSRVDVVGVSCYSSKDLWTWKNEGVVLIGDKTNTSSDLHVSNVVERPKVIYNDRTKQYVMWMHIDNVNYSKASVGIAVSSRPEGPFNYLGSKRPHGHDSRDMTIFKDDDGSAYLLYSSKDNSELHVGILTSDYLDLKKGFKRILIGQRREAPAVFKYKGIYYMVTSGCSGWNPNPAQVHAAESMLGPWEALGDPCVGKPPEFRAATFFSQGTFVLPLPGLSDTFLFMADRWKPPDLKDSRYVWLPLIMDGPVNEPVEEEFDFPIWQRVEVSWHRRWKLKLGWDNSPSVAIF
ncbi:unnamed protein product [Calypogeia fissa]